MLKGKMNRQELIQKARAIVYKRYWNGVSLDINSAQLNEKFEICLDYYLPRKVFDEETNTLSTYFLLLKKVGILNLNKDGSFINSLERDELTLNTLQKYKELTS